MSWFRIDFTPLEPYTFGTEQGSRFEGADATGKESYIMTANRFPDQTTILGTLRYLVLRGNNALNSDFKYEGHIDEVNRLIGSESFAFSSENVQGFGKIKSLSPVFIMNKYTGEKYIKNPFCNTAKNGFRPMKMLKSVMTSKGEISLPQNDEEGYKAKNGYAEGFIGLTSGNVLENSDIFTKIVFSGNRTELRGIESDKTENDEGFFKREAFILAKDFCFSVYLDAEDDAFGNETEQIAYMGRKNTAFNVKICVDEISGEDTAGKKLAKEVSEAFERISAESSDCWYYALSDVYCTELPCYENFSIVEEKQIRNLETILSEEKYSRKRRKSQRMNLIMSGSVFYEYKPQLMANVNCENAGFNTIVKIGGNK